MTDTTGTAPLSDPVRAAEAQDIPGITEMLARAFLDDPQFVWVMPSERSRAARLHRFFSTLLRIEGLGFAEMDVLETDGRVAGAAVWFAPGDWPPPPGRQVRALPGYLRAFGRRVGSASRLVTAAARVHPTGKYRYLACIGVEPATQGRGLGAALLRPPLARCDAEGVAAFLESSNTDNVPLYEHFGFEALDALELGHGAPRITPMIRHPRTAGPADGSAVAAAN